ncbi:Cupin domain protein [Marinibacterium anthonyi]|nr:Cupin domain protein [Marinibacterium anthonyi]
MTPQSETQTDTHIDGGPHAGGKLRATDIARFSGIEAAILMGGADAPFSVMEMVVAPGLGAPAHVSPREDKVFHVTDGGFLFLVGEARITAGPGDHLFVGKGQVHGFSARGDGPGRMTLVSTPALHDRFFRALSALDLPHDPAKVAAVCAACDQRIVGPVVGPVIGPVVGPTDKDNVG